MKQKCSAKQKCSLSVMHKAPKHGLLGCDTMESGGCLPLFWKNVVPSYLQNMFCIVLSIFPLSQTNCRLKCVVNWN
jgi:hypothetical protein